MAKKILKQIDPQEVVREFNQRIQKKAERLYQVRRLLDEIEEKREVETSKLKQERDMLQADLLSDMRAANQKKTETLDGVPVTIKAAHGLEITNEISAFKWAYENRLVTIDKTLVKQRLKDQKTMPAGFALVDREYISVGKKKE